MAFPENSLLRRKNSLRVIKLLSFFNDVATFLAFFPCWQGISYAGVRPAEEG